jgi:hypothetical protein
MPTTVITGRSIAFTYDSTNYDDQIISATVTLDDPTASVQTLNGLVDYLVDKEVGTLTVQLVQYVTIFGQMLTQIQQQLKQ